MESKPGWLVALVEWKGRNAIRRAVTSTVGVDSTVRASRRREASSPGSAALVAGKGVNGIWKVVASTVGVDSTARASRRILPQGKPDGEVVSGEMRSVIAVTWRSRTRDDGMWCDRGLDPYHARDQARRRVTQLAELFLEPRSPPTLAVGFTASAEILPPSFITNLSPSGLPLR